MIDVTKLKINAFKMGSCLKIFNLFPGQFNKITPLGNEGAIKKNLDYGKFEEFFCRARQVFALRSWVYLNRYHMVDSDCVLSQPYSVPNMELNVPEVDGIQSGPGQG